MRANSSTSYHSFCCWRSISTSSRFSIFASRSSTVILHPLQLLLRFVNRVENDSNHLRQSHGFIRSGQRIHLFEDCESRVERHGIPIPTWQAPISVPSHFIPLAAVFLRHNLHDDHHPRRETRFCRPRCTGALCCPA